MRKIVLIKKYRDKISLSLNGEELCNITVAHSNKQIQSLVCIETNNKDLRIHREDLEENV